MYEKHIDIVHKIFILAITKIKIYYCMERTINSQTMSDNCRKLVGFVREAGPNGIEKTVLISQLKSEWDAYVKNEEVKAQNKEKEAEFKKKMRLHKRTLGIFKKPQAPKLAPTREYSKDEIPVPCNSEFGDIAFEAFSKGLLISQKVGGKEYIYRTDKKI